MSTRKLRGLACLVLSLAVTACGDDTSVPELDGGPRVDSGTPAADASTPVDAATADDAATEDDAGSEDLDAAVADAGELDASMSDAGLDTISVTGTIRELGAGGVGAVQRDVEVCVDARADIPCEISDVSGTFTSTVIPASTEMLLTFEKTGYVPALATVTTGTTDVSFNYFIVTPSTVNTLGLVVMETIDPADGHLFVQLGEGEASAGATVSISTPDAAGPFYTNASGFPSTTATVTSTSGTALFANVPPGDHVVTITPASGRTCVPTGFAWEGAVAGTVRVRIRAGHITSTNSECM